MFFSKGDTVVARSFCSAESSRGGLFAVYTRSQSLRRTARQLFYGSFARLRHSQDFALTFDETACASARAFHSLASVTEPARDEIEE